MSTTELPAHDVSPVSIEDEMRRSYLDYAMSVIVSRALPDARDGLKPVHRRILYAMREGGYVADRPYRKSARIVGDVMGRYHPHGDQAIYDAMVRMAQAFSMRLQLIDGQGNFGSIDGDPPAAMRYTEVRMGRAAHALLEDIDKDTVDFEDNYDGSAREPEVLPARFPNLLVNGAGGIAVGMATNLPPHNLGETVDACLALIDDPEISIEGLMTHMQAPDFPTGGIIMGTAGVISAFKTGRGSVVVRSKVHFETVRKDREAIIVTETPYQVNKTRLVEQIADVARTKRIEGISDLRDESDRDGMRIVIEVRRDVNIDVVLNQLYRFTSLQASFGVNMLALNGGRPELLDLKQLLAAFVAFREEVILRRTRHDLGKARDRAHLLVGLAVAVANIDAVITMIRAAPDAAVARERLMAEAWPATEVEALIALIDDAAERIVEGHYRLSEGQARAILDLRLHRLTALERGKIGDDLKEIVVKIREYLAILRDREKLVAVMREDLIAVRDQFATPRRTEVQASAVEHADEDLIQREDMVLTVTHTGYIKRVPLSTYRAQRRGGRGRAGMATREADFVTQVFVVNTHTPVLFFSSHGKVYTMKTYHLPQAAPQARGKAMVNLLPLAEGETITTLMPMPEDEADWQELEIMFATERGRVRRNRLSDFANIMANGKIAMRLDDDDRLIGVHTCGEGDDVLLAARNGKCTRFATTDVRLFKGRASSGVRGMRLAKDVTVISMSLLHHVELDVAERKAYGHEGDAMSAERRAELSAHEQHLLTVTENGFGKRTSAYEYRVTGRGGQGVINIETSARNGPVVASFPVTNGDEIMLVTHDGQIIRMPVHDIRIAGRNTQGVILFRTGKGERVVSVARLDDVGDDDVEGDDVQGDA